MNKLVRRHPIISQVIGQGQIWSHKCLLWRKLLESDYVGNNLQQLTKVITGYAYIRFLTLGECLPLP